MLKICDDLGVRTSATFLGEKVKNIHQTYDCACNRLCPLLGHTHSTQQIAVVPLFSWWKADKNKELKKRVRPHHTYLSVRRWVGASVRICVHLYLHASPAEMMLSLSDCNCSCICVCTRPVNALKAGLGVIQVPKRLIQSCPHPILPFTLIHINFNHNQPLCRT